MALAATLYTDPGCPWAYCANPDLTVLRWRFGDALDWRIAMIGLSEDGSSCERRGYTPARHGAGLSHVPRPLRDAVRSRTARARDGYRARLPRARRDRAALPGA